MTLFHDTLLSHLETLPTRCSPRSATRAFTHENVPAAGLEYPGGSIITRKRSRCEPEVPRREHYHTKTFLPRVRRTPVEALSHENVPAAGLEYPGGSIITRKRSRCGSGVLRRKHYHTKTSPLRVQRTLAEALSSENVPSAGLEHPGGSILGHIRTCRETER